MNDTQKPTGKSVASDLPRGTELLQGQYVIQEFLNSGGFGITYLARDSLDRTVVIKECFPATFCRRDNGRVCAISDKQQKDFNAIVRLFLREARQLSKLDHPNIVGVHQVFEDRDTAYMALDCIEGLDLLDVLEDQRRKLGPAQVRAMLMKMLNAIAFVHSKGILHRDISPDNILLDKKGEPILIDFGAAREKATRASRALSALMVVKDGYSPQEFYIAGSEQGPSSDIYSLAATFYHVVTGKPPPNSQTRVAAIAANEPDPYVPLAFATDGYGQDFLQAIDKAMSIFPKDRFQIAEEWILAIDEERRVAVALAEARRNRNIDRAISQLVADTNRAVQEEMLREIETLEDDEPDNDAQPEGVSAHPEEPGQDFLSEEDDTEASIQEMLSSEADADADPEPDTEDAAEPEELADQQDHAPDHQVMENVRAQIAAAAKAEAFAQLFESKENIATARRMSFWRKLRKISVWRVKDTEGSGSDHIGRTG